MFGSKKGAGTQAQASRPASPRSGSANGTTLISKSTEITGDLKFTGSLVVEGKVTGNIICDEGSDAKLQLFDSGVVCGEIRVPTVVINGRVEGDVYASEHVELAARAIVDGNVHYQLIEMVKGAQVNGNLVYGKATGEPVITVAEDAGETKGPVISLNDDTKAIDEVGTENGKPVVPIAEEKSSNTANSGAGFKSRGGRRR